MQCTYVLRALCIGYYTHREKKGCENNKKNSPIMNI